AMVVSRYVIASFLFVFFSSRRRHTRCYRDWSSDVCSSDLRLLETCAQRRAPDHHVRRISDGRQVSRRRKGGLGGGWPKCKKGFYVRDLLSASKHAQTYV